MFEVRMSFAAMFATHTGSIYTPMSDERWYWSILLLLRRMLINLLFVASHVLGLDWRTTVALLLGTARAAPWHCHTWHCHVTYCHTMILLGARGTKCLFYV